MLVIRDGWRDVLKLACDTGLLGVTHAEAKSLYPAHLTDEFRAAAKVFLEE